jgi:hypothetical protein
VPLITRILSTLSSNYVCIGSYTLIHSFEVLASAAYDRR